jgi:hypothetical protein
MSSIGFWLAAVSAAANPVADDVSVACAPDSTPFSFGSTPEHSAHDEPRVLVS